jgi:hypothetical protein
MRDINLELLVCNVILNKVMKRDFNYDFILKLKPSLFIKNRISNNSRNTFEIIYIKTSYHFNDESKKELKERLKENLNYILCVIEGIDYHKVEFLHLKFNL